MSPFSATAKAFNEIFGEPFTPKGLEMRVKYSIEANVDKIDTPILIQATDKEVYGFESVYNALTAADKPVEMFIYPDERHVKWQPAHNAIIYRRNLDWFKFWLRGVQDDRPEKAEQYKRWRAMRENQCERLTGDDAPWYCKNGEVKPPVQ